MKAVIILVLLSVTMSSVINAQPKSKADIVKEALSATTPAMARNASVMDWDGNKLKEGTNGYTCMPSPPGRTVPEPMCLDDRWVSWGTSWEKHEAPPKIKTLGFGYMLLGGGSDSNKDPYAEGRTSDNEWMETQPPHLMLLVPDLSELEGMSTKFDSGGPWVMWSGTPYAHIMAPVK